MRLKAAVRFQVERLRLRSGRSTAREALTDEAVAISEGELHVPLRPMRMRLIAIQ